jgi:hypothetical protein
MTASVRGSTVTGRSRRRPAIRLHEAARALTSAVDSRRSSEE